MFPEDPFCGQFPELVECIPGWIAGMEDCRLGGWGVEVALRAGEKFGCTAFAVGDGVGGWPAYIRAESVMKHSPSKFFPFLVQSLETEVMALQTHWVLAMGGEYLRPWSIFSNSAVVRISTYTGSVTRNRAELLCVSVLEKCFSSKINGCWELVFPVAPFKPLHGAQLTLPCSL